MGSGLLRKKGKAKKLLTPEIFLQMAKVEKTDVEITNTAVKEVKDAGKHASLADAQVYFPDAAIGDEITYPTLWMFHFPLVGNAELPTQMGEHGDNLEAAKERVLERLKAIFAEKETATANPKAE